MIDVIAFVLAAFIIGGLLALYRIDNASPS